MQRAGWERTIMNRDRAEELLMVAIAICMFTYLLPFSLPRDILATLVVAVALVVLLVLRSISWHLEEITPFDGVLLLGICLSIVHLLSFFAFQQGVLSAMVIVLFAVFYFLMAFLLYRHRWLFRPQPAYHAPRYASRARPRAQERQERPRRSFLRRVFRRDHAHDPAFRRGIEPIHEISEHDHGHDPIFKRGIEPIPPLETYGHESRKKKI